jgi:hypothetical protein
MPNLDSFFDNSPGPASTLRLYVIENTLQLYLCFADLGRLSLALFIRHPIYNYDDRKVYHTTLTRAAVLRPVMPVVSLVFTIEILALLSSITAFLAIRDYQKRGGLPYPPGPRRLPLIGNLFDVPKEFSWLTFSRLSKKHGKAYFAIK